MGPTEEGLVERRRKDNVHTWGTEDSRRREGHTHRETHTQRVSGLCQSGHTLAPPEALHERAFGSWDRHVTPANARPN